jgi:hypothetical protein
MANRILPKSLEELLTDIEREWQALMAVVEWLTPEQMTTPDPGGWSPKDNLAHLSAWMNFMLKSCLGTMPGYLALGIEEQKLKGLSEDEENAILFERDRGRSTAEVLSELKNTHTETVKKLKTMEFQDLMKPLKSNQAQPPLVIDVVLGNTSEHFAEHRITIERVLNTRKS